MAMDLDKYTEVTNKLIEADKKVIDAVKTMCKEVREVVKDLSREELEDWAKKAADDNNVGAALYTVALKEWTDNRLS